MENNNYIQYVLLINMEEKIFILYIVYFLWNFMINNDSKIYLLKNNFSIFWINFDKKQLVEIDGFDIL